MINFAYLDIMVRGGSLALLTLWSWLLVRDQWAALPARIAVCMNGAIICHVFSTIKGAISISSPIDGLLVVGSTAVPGFFWLFARSWFNDENRINWRSWALVTASMALTVSHILLTKTHFPGTQMSLFGLISRAMMFFFALAGLVTAWRGRVGDLVEARRKLRALMIWAVGSYVIVALVLEIAVYRNFIPRAVLTLIEFGILILCWSLCAAMFAHRQNDLFASSSAKVEIDPPTDDLASSALIERLQRHMESERAYRNETLTIAALASQLGEQEYRLRRLINGRLGYRNFAAFLNGYRLAEVKQALSDPAQKQVPIITIALDAGFGSLGPFNRAFRESEAMTPSAYRGRS